MDALRRWAVLLDSAFKVPGTNIRFGLDAIIGLVPGLGDLVAPIFTVILLGTALRCASPPSSSRGWYSSPGIDMLLGLVPIAGDIGDVFWKADLRNMALLERHARPGVPPTRGDYLFVLGCIASWSCLARADRPAGLVVVPLLVGVRSARRSAA